MLHCPSAEALASRTRPTLTALPSAAPPTPTFLPTSKDNSCVRTTPSTRRIGATVAEETPTFCNIMVAWLELKNPTWCIDPSVTQLNCHRTRPDLKLNPSPTTPMARAGMLTFCRTAEDWLKSTNPINWCRIRIKKLWGRRLSRCFPIKCSHRRMYVNRNHSTLRRVWPSKKNRRNKKCSWLLMS